MATMHFNWGALSAYEPAEQLDMVTQVTSLLSPEQREVFMQTEGFHDWVSSPKMNEYLMQRMAEDEAQ